MAWASPGTAPDRIAWQHSSVPASGSQLTRGNRLRPLSIRFWNELKDTDEGARAFFRGGNLTLSVDTWRVLPVKMHRPILSGTHTFAVSTEGLTSVFFSVTHSGYGGRAVLV